MRNLQPSTANFLLPEAARAGRAQLVRYLVGRIAEPTVRREATSAALRAALMAGRGDVVLELLVAGVRR